MKRFLVTALCMLTLFPTVAYAEEETGIHVTVEADGDIDFLEGDSFKVQFYNMETQEKSEFSIDASAIEGESDKINLQEGLYEVIDFEYEGYNENILGKDMAIISQFYASPDYEFVTIAVGPENAISLETTNSKVMVKPGTKVEDTEDIETPKNDSETSSTGQSPNIVEEDLISKAEVDKPNYLLAFMPIVVIALIGGIVLYVLHKKKKI